MRALRRAVKRLHRHRTWAALYLTITDRLKIAPTHGVIWPSLQPERYLGRFSVSAGLTTVTNRVTDHASRSVTIGRTYVRGTAIRPENERCPRLIRVTM